MLWPLIEVLVAFLSAVFVFAAGAEWLTRGDGRSAPARRGRPGLGRAWWQQKEREERARRWRS